MKLQPSKKIKQIRLPEVRTLSFKIGVLISIILIATPFLFYLYQYAPNDSKIWETKYFTIHSGEFSDVNSFLWNLLSKSLSVLGFSIWFLTCKHWWRYAILVPLTMYLYQLSGVIDQQIGYIDNFSYWNVFFTLPIVILHIIAARNLKFLIKKFDVSDQVDAKIESLLKDKA